MKIKEGFLLREMVGQWVVVPIGNTVIDFNRIITLTPSAALLWKELEEGVDNTSKLVDVILGEYEVNEETAKQDCEEFIGKLKDQDMLE